MGRAETVSPPPPTSTVTLRLPGCACPRLPVTQMSRCPRTDRGHQVSPGDRAPSREHPGGELEESQPSCRLLAPQPEQGPTQMPRAHVSEPRPASCTWGPSRHGEPHGSEGPPPGLLICFHGLEILSNFEWG